MKNLEQNLLLFFIRLGRHRGSHSTSVGGGNTPIVVYQPPRKVLEEEETQKKKNGSNICSVVCAKAIVAQYSQRKFLI